MEKNIWEISWGSLWKIFFMLILVFALFLAGKILLILFLAIVISSAFDAPVSFLQSKKIPRLLGTLTIFLTVIGILSFILYIIIPISVIEFKNLLDGLNDLKLPVLGNLNTSGISDNFDKNLGNFANVLLGGGTSFINVITNVFGNIILIIVTFVLSFYLTLDQKGVEKFLKIILPLNYEDYAVDVYMRVKRKLGLWLQGQIILMLAVGLVTFLGLWLLGIKYSLVLGLLAGILEIVPIAGPVFAGFIAFLAAASQSLIFGFYVILLFILIQQIETHLLVPTVMKKTIGISPVVVVISILVGSQIAGFVGIVLAVPTVVIIQELLEDWSVKKAAAAEKTS